jgi:DNA-binding FadR family transcriptional regulator
VEHFEQILFPEVIALAAAEATDEELEAIRQAGRAYLEEAKVLMGDYWDVSPLPLVIEQQYLASYQQVIKAIFAATHNRVLQLLAGPLLRLRNLRNWEEEGATLEGVLAMESTYLETVIEAIASRDPTQARQIMTRLMQLPPEAEAVMRQTPVGQVPVIPVGRNTEAI